MRTKNNMKDLKLKTHPVRRRTVNVLVTLALILVVCLCLFVVIQVLSQGYVNIGGYSLFRVVTGSMEPTIPVGALLVSKKIEMDAVQVNDIICFQAQETAILGKMMTHRVVDIYPAADGSLMFATKGDANLSADGYLVTQSNFVGKVIWYTGANSVLSSIISFFTNKIGFLACIVIPCLLLAGLILKDCVKNIRNELQETLEELEKDPEPKDPLLELSEEELNKMYERIRAELIEELMDGAEKPKEQ